MFLWRAFTGAVLGMAVVVAIWLVLPITVLEGALLGAGLPVAALWAGGAMDLRADRRRDYDRGDQQ